MLGDVTAAGEAHAELRAIAEATGTKSLLAAERVAAAAIADADEARLALEEAVDLYRASPAPFEAATAQLELARVLEASGRPQPALGQAREACDVLERLGADHEAARAQKLVVALGGRVRGGLTARELDVLAAAAEGLSNRQIAERLVVSEHTVHRHLSNIYVKLGVSSRAAAVAVATQREVL
jgi:DNA-binding NarL/FixJ family response regulator